MMIFGATLYSQDIPENKYAGLGFLMLGFSVVLLGFGLLAFVMKRRDW
jgi:hypothetical protein